MNKITEVQVVSVCKSISIITIMVFLMMCSFFAGIHYLTYRLTNALKTETVACEAILNVSAVEQHVFRSQVAIDYRKILVANSKIFW
jgi:sensor domain CHASE-containing protein